MELIEGLRKLASPDATAMAEKAMAMAKKKEEVVKFAGAPDPFEQWLSTTSEPDSFSGAPDPFAGAPDPFAGAPDPAPHQAPPPAMGGFDAFGAAPAPAPAPPPMMGSTPAGAMGSGPPPGAMGGGMMGGPPVERQNTEARLEESLRVLGL